MKIIIHIGLILFLVGFCSSAILNAQIILISDPLDGSTVGQQAGNGEFVTGGGWRSLGGKIVFDAGQILESGSFEAIMRGWTAPAQGTEKTHILSGWEEADAYTHWIQPGSFWNWRIGSRYSPFKVLAAYDSITTREDTWWSIATSEMINDGQSHLYKVAWDAGNVTFYLDADSLHMFEFPFYKMRYFTIGVDDMYGPANPAPIISDVRIVDNNAVIANFTANQTAGVAPLTVHFLDSSEGNILNHMWDFGDGQTSSEQHPTYIYENADTFTVSLIVSGQSKADTLIRPDYIIITDPPPVADFTADTTMGLRPLEVQFSDLSAGIITSWLWNLGDGTNSTEQHPTHTYQTADTFTVSLTTTGPGGEHTKTELDYITVLEPPPVADFTADTTEGIIPFEVQFSDQSTGQVSVWIWEFGDGETSSDQHPIHTYQDADTFDVTLTVTGLGGESTKKRTGYIISSGTSGVDDQIRQIPDRFELSQNYPNPFNPTTSIWYSLKEDGPVRLMLYDLRGREILQLVNEIQEAGWHEIKLGGTDLSSGIYLYKLESTNEILTRKLTILK
ncbi:PKD domain-containing protein [candidate division KSB1 bacterium]|nr:PKD domain-containing protein [candidate division KSB1 bacterium]